MSAPVALSPERLHAANASHNKRFVWLNVWTKHADTRLLPAYRLRKGVDVSSSSQGVCVDLHVVVEQGVNMASVVDNLSASVKFLLRQIAELENVKVTVHIEAMRASR